MAGYIFVDAGLPHPGRSHLEEIEAGASDFGRALRKDLDAGGSFPQWTDEELRELIPNAGLRQGLLAELHPRHLAFFAEPFPHVEIWPNTPCAYIRLSQGYAGPAQQAQQSGWPYWEFDAGHFHMLADAAAVVEAMLLLTSSIVDLEGGLSESL